MNNKSGLIRLTGIMCMVLSAVVIGWYLLLDHASTDLQDISASPGKYLGFITLDILYEIILISLGALFFLILHRHSQPLALCGFLGLLGNGLLWLIYDFPAYSLYGLAQEYLAANGAAAAAIAERAADISAAFTFPTIMSGTFYSIGFIALGVLIMRTKAIHPALGLLAIVLGILHLFDWVGALTMIASGDNVTDDWGTFWDAFLYANDAWFFIVGLWLLAKGVRESPVSE